MEKKQIIRKAIFVIILILVLVLTGKFLLNEKICIKIAGIGNIFLLLWLVSADPLQVRIRKKTNSKRFDFLICAVLIWAAAYIFEVNDLCDRLAEMIKDIGDFFPSLAKIF
jgi:hypothetical protein